MASEKIKAGHWYWWINEERPVYVRQVITGAAYCYVPVMIYDQVPTTETHSVKLSQLCQIQTEVDEPEY